MFAIPTAALARPRTLAPPPSIQTAPPQMAPQHVQEIRPHHVLADGLRPHARRVVARHGTRRPQHARPRLC
jgi:hypothetical protein